MQPLQSKNKAIQLLQTFISGMIALGLFLLTTSTQYVQAHGGAATTKPNIAITQPSQPPISIRNAKKESSFKPSPSIPLSMQHQSLLGQAAKLLRRWRADEAAKILLPVIQRGKLPPPALMLLARVRYFQGQFKKSIELYEKAAPIRQLKAISSTYLSVKATYKISLNSKKMISPHFIITYPAGRDKLLVRYAVGALEKAYHRLGKIFHYYPRTRVHVQFLSEAMQLADMSPLTEGDIMRTGTIALCKYNRVMITSPRALLRGYRWLDTLIHEYTHLVVNRVSAGIPIWLHEGLARYAEILWRSDSPAPLSPYSESILAKGLRDNKLVPFKKMHPSMAKLPSHEESALAYAQVYTVVVYFVKIRGQQKIAELLRLVHGGTSVPKAFEKILRYGFPAFLKHWKKHMKQQNLQIHEGVLPNKKVLKGHRPQKKKKESPNDLWARPSSSKAKGERFLRLGEMLRAQGRTKAALFELLKAETHWKNRNPKLQNKIALLYIQTKQYKKAIPPLLRSLKLYPSYMTTFVNLGRAYYHSKQHLQAQNFLEESLQINPFHPSIHRYLRSIYKKQGKKKLAKREAEVYRILRSPE